MIDMFKAIWFQESRIIGRRIFSQALGPILLGIVFFFIFSLPMRNIINPSEWSTYITQLVFHTSIFTFIYTVFIRVSSFYWYAQYSNSGYQLLLLGSKGNDLFIFIAESIIAFFFGSIYAIITFFVLSQFDVSISQTIQFPSVILFWVLIGIQFAALGKIVGSLIQSEEGKWSVMFLGIVPLLLLSGIFMKNVPSLAINIEYLTPFNLVYGITQGYMLGNIQYNILLFSIIESIFIAWIAGRLIQLKAR